MRQIQHFRVAAIAILIFLGYTLPAQNHTMSFDGTLTEYVDLGNHSSLNTNHITVEFWMKASTGTFAQSNVVDKSHEAGGYEGWGFEFDGAGQKLNFYYMNGAAIGVVTSTANLDDNVWHHIAGTYNGTIAYLYVDGVEQANSSAVTGNLNPTTGNLYLASWKGTGRWFPGQIEEVRIWDVALPLPTISYYKDSEINLSHPYRVGTDHLVAYYQMSDGAGLSLTDNSANSNTGTLSGGGMGDVNWITDSPLPLDLLYFEAECLGHETELNWATASEMNVSHFEIYGSMDGVDFDKISSIQAAGTSHELMEYSLIVTKGFRYFHLKEIDIDGATYDLGTIFNDCTIDKEAEIKLYPNPAVNQLNIEISNFETGSILSIYNMNGTLAYEQNMDAATTQLDIQNLLPSGIYFVQIKGDRIQYTNRLIVQ